jgi:hypothetical protein
MSSGMLLRLGGLAAIVAGVLRAGASFLGYSEPTLPRELLYLIIDVSILFGLLGIYFYQSADVGKSGFAGFFLSVTGTAIIVGPDATLGGVNMYAVGAAMLLVGLTFLAVGSWGAGRLPRYVSACWVLSTVSGVGAFLVGSPAIVMMLAGIAFGIGFIGAGARIWSDPSLRAT